MILQVGDITRQKSANQQIPAFEWIPHTIVGLFMLLK